MKYLILGAGPAGLTFANCLLGAGIKDFLVIEKENSPGGLCRSVSVDGADLDIGGGHFLDTKRKQVTEYLFRFMPENEWNVFERDSQIYVHNQYIHHPFEANIWEFFIDDQIEYLKSIAAAGCNTGEDMPDEFVSWISWKLGKRIAEDYMIPYNQKMFGDNLNRLGTYWLDKLPNVSFEDTLRSCLERKAYAKQPGHATFYYPKEHGYGELWLRMGQKLGDRLMLGHSVDVLDIEKRMVKTSHGDIYDANTLITTIPWDSIKEIRGIAGEIRDSIFYLKHTSVRISYHGGDMDTSAHWIYYPDKGLNYHRILVRKNFCAMSRGYWTETNEERHTAREDGGFSYVNEYAYPLNTLDKPAVMDRLLRCCRENGVIGLGRWGEHEHYNSDVTVQKAMELAQEMAAR